MIDVVEEGRVVSGAEMVAENGMVALLNRSEIDQQIATAHKFPRSLKRFRDEALQMVTLTEQIAQECIYSLPRDGKTIEGPSARFAEVIASAWGNCRAGARVVSDQGEFVTSQGVFHDLEKNVAITYEVQRRIVDKNGRRYKADMIGVTANAACSIALRNAILKGVPKAFWSSMYQAARKTVMGDFKTLANRRADAIAEFQRFGVLPPQICAALGVAGVEDIGLEHLVTLRGLLTAIQEGDTTPEQAFGTEKKPVDMPKSKQEPTESTPPTAQSTPPAPPTGTDSGAAVVDPKPTEPDTQLMNDGQRRIIRAKLKNAGLTDIDLHAKFAKKLGTDEQPTEFLFAEFETVTAWIAENAK